MRNRLLADDSHEISYLIFVKTRKDVAKFVVCCFMIGAFKVKFIILVTDGLAVVLNVSAIKCYLQRYFF